MTISLASTLSRNFLALILNDFRPENFKIISSLPKNRYGTLPGDENFD